MAGAIWSAPPNAILNYPAASFIRFHDNHGLLQFSNRPKWRTPRGRSRVYVDRLTTPLAARIKIGLTAQKIRRSGTTVFVRDSAGNLTSFDHVVVATHADQALAMLDDPREAERKLLGAFRYSRNVAILHKDPTFMPRRRAVWSSWNYIEQSTAGQQGCTVTYWLNRLQNLGSVPSLFVTLNPQRIPDPQMLISEHTYEHPLFDQVAIAAQRKLWSLQGVRNTWFCGSYFGAGFHEDALQSGLAVAESLGSVRRPWHVQNESGRIFTDNVAPRVEATEVAA
jgi:predicted NAD/FAD-binding protein